MLCDSKDRLSAENILKHKWFDNKGFIDKLFSEKIIENRKKYINYNNIKKAVLLFIASRLSDSEIKNLKESFHKLDLNRDGTISIDEFKKGIYELTKDFLT